MNAHKRQSIQKLILSESGSETLDLNDIVLGYQGARIVATLLPQYHQNIRHVRLNGNNIDSQGFELIFTALLNCQHLKSIQAEWNSIGSSEMGLQSLLQLVRSLHYLQFIDLKNNRISHHQATYIAQIIELNRKNLKVIDLRWNEIGELGARQILEVLHLNRNIKFIGLEDNRVSTATLMEIESILKSQSYNQDGNAPKHGSSLPNNTFTSQYFPISAGEYPSMDIQLRSSEIRSKIEMEQKQAIRYSQKIEIEINKVVQKVRLKGTQIGELQQKYGVLMNENYKVTAELRQAERVLALEKERLLGMDRKLSTDKSEMRVEKYKLNGNIQNVMEKYTQRNQRELEELEMVMQQKLDRLNAYLKERLHEKRTSRQKLADIKEDIMKFKLNKQQVWNRTASSSAISPLTAFNKNAWQEQCYALEQLFQKSKSTVQSESKKGDYMSEELNTQILRALKKQQKLEEEIFEHQNKIKTLHNDMANRNLDIEKNITSLKLLESKVYDRELAIEMLRRYVKYIQSQNAISAEIENMRQDQLGKVERVAEESIEIRIADVERALRAQQANNKMIKNQYEKLMSQLESVSKKNIQIVLFQ